MNRSSLALSLALTLPSTLIAQDVLVESQTILDPGGATDWEFFGAAVALSGDWAAIGSEAYYEVEIYERNGDHWQRHSTLTGPPQSRFGDTLAMHDDVLIVGASYEDSFATHAGAVYVYRQIAGAWTLEDTLHASDWKNFARFGFSVGFDGETIVVGAPYHDGAKSRQGQAYTFVKSGSNWVEQGILTDPSPATDKLFGWDVDVSADTAIIGVNPDPFVYLGEAHTYERAGVSWSHGEELLASDTAVGFGRGISMDGDTILVRGLAHAYVFERAVTWQEVLIIDPPGGMGSGALLVGDRMLINNHPLSADVFPSRLLRWERVAGTWTPSGDLRAGTWTDPIDSFGASVAMDGERVLVGALSDHTLGQSTGRAYAFDLDTPSIGASYCTSNPHHDGGPARLTALGEEDVLRGQLTLVAHDLPEDEFGYFLMSEAQGNSAIPGSDGILCLGGTIFRFVKDVASSGRGGTITLRPDFQNLPQGQVFLAGSTWNFQLWFRAQSTSNTTEGVSVSWL